MLMQSDFCRLDLEEAAIFLTLNRIIRAASVAGISAEMFVQPRDIYRNYLRNSPSQRSRLPGRCGLAYRDRYRLGAGDEDRSRADRKGLRSAFGLHARAANFIAFSWNGFVGQFMPWRRHRIPLDPAGAL